jgi:hypothetical protein
MRAIVPPETREDSRATLPSQTTRIYRNAVRAALSSATEDGFYRVQKLQARQGLEPVTRGFGIIWMFTHLLSRRAITPPALRHLVGSLGVSIAILPNP